MPDADLSKQLLEPRSLAAKGLSLPPLTLKAAGARGSVRFKLRSEKRSWFSLVISGFGGVIVQYWKTVRERVWGVHTKPGNRRRKRRAQPRR